MVPSSRIAAGSQPLVQMVHELQNWRRRGPLKRKLLASASPAPSGQRKRQNGRNVNRAATIKIAHQTIQMKTMLKL